jgi:hypothetical protein
MIEKMKILYDIFNAPSIIHMKFMKLHMYTIKRLAHLTFLKGVFSEDGGGQETSYQQQSWTEALPSDPEIIASIFCHLMDISFHGQFPKETTKYTVHHLLNSSQVNDIHYMPDD